MKYTILLPLEIDADPADLRDAANKGFHALAAIVNGEESATIHLIPQDGGQEAHFTSAILSSSFTATTTFS